MKLPKRIAADQRRRCEVLRDMLSQVMGRPPGVRAIMAWTADDREHAEEWARRELLHASDNPIQRIETPQRICAADIYRAPRQVKSTGDALRDFAGGAVEGDF